MSRSVAIVGGGVIGLCTAYYCARRGLDVTVIEAKSAQRDGCSFGNAGILAASHIVPLAAPGMIGLGLKWMWNPASPFYIKPRLDADLLAWGIGFYRAANARQVSRAAPLLRDLLLASRGLFEQIAALPEVEFDLVKKGLLMLCQEEHALDEEAAFADQASALGIEANVLDARQVAALDPGAQMDIVGAVHFPADSHLNPARFMVAMQRLCVQSGVRFIWDRQVVDARIDNRRIRSLRTADGNAIVADEFVLCGGSWSPVLGRTLGLTIPIEAGKGYSLTLPNPRRLPIIASILVEAQAAVTPMGGALRVGGTMEIAGLSEDVNPVRVQGIVDSFCRYYPEFRPDDFHGIEPWRGLRPCSPDGLPFVGRAGRFQNLSIAAGHAMIGLSLGPVTGQMMSRILCGEEPAMDIAMLSPDRFG